MNLTKNQKVVLGIFTLLPFLLLPYIIFEIFTFVIHATKLHSSEPDAAEILTGIFAFIFPIILLSLLSLGLLIIYIIHAAGNKMIDSTERIIWILTFLFFGIIAFAVYWFLRIRPDENKA